MHPVRVAYPRAAGHVGPPDGHQPALTHCAKAGSAAAVADGCGPTPVGNLGAQTASAGAHTSALASGTTWRDGMGPGVGLECWVLGVGGPRLRLGVGVGCWVLGVGGPGFGV